MRVVAIQNGGIFLRITFGVVTKGRDCEHLKIVCGRPGLFGDVVQGVLLWLPRRKNLIPGSVFVHQKPMYCGTPLFPRLQGAHH